MSFDPTVGDLLGKHTDSNFDEPEPVFNSKSSLLAVMITMTVRLLVQGIGGSLRMLTSVVLVALDHFLALSLI